MKALVTGGAGFIGSHLVDRLLEEGYDVLVFDDLSGGDRANVHPAARLVVGDVAEPTQLMRVMAGTDVVFHLAAHRAVLRSVENPIETDQANTRGTLAVLETARRTQVRRVVYASSSSVYGGAAAMPTPETARPQPRSPYAVTKLTGEHYCRVFTELYGLETVALRYFNVFGPRQRPDAAYAAVIPLFASALLRGERPVVHGDGHQSRDFTFVSNVVDAALAAASTPVETCSGHVYNVAMGLQWSLLDILNVMGAQLQVDVKPLFEPSRPGDIRHSQADIAVAQRELGWRPQISVEEGIRRTVDYLIALPGEDAYPAAPRILNLRAQELAGTRL